MSYSIRGTVIDTNTQNPVPNLDIAICDPDSGAVLLTTSTGSVSAFNIPLTFEQRLELTQGSIHRALVFKVYEGPYFLGAQEIVLCDSVFVGTHLLTIEVDADFTPPVEGCVYAVAGCLVEPNGTPIANAEIKLFKRTLSSEAELDTKITNANGEFLVRYYAPAGVFPDQADISIIVRAIQNGNTVANLGPICNPPHDLTVTLVVGDAPLRGPAETVHLTRTLTPLLDGKTYDQLTFEDVEFLICTTGFESATVALVARAHQLGIDFSVPVEAFYALGRAGFPLGPTALVGIDDAAITSTITQAVADNIIPEDIEAQLPTILAAFAAKRLDRAIPLNDPTSTVLGSLMATIPLIPLTLPRDFVEKHAAFAGNDEAFWAYLRGEPDYQDAVVEQIQFTLVAGAVSASYTNMVKLLQVKRTQSEVTDPRDLARYTAQDWIAFTNEIVDGQVVGAPEGLPGDTDAERATAFGHAIARMVEDLYPTSFTAHHLTPGLLNSDAVAFVEANPDFSLNRTVIDGPFFDQAQGVPNDPQLAAELKADLQRLQRVFSVAPRFGRSAAVNTLLGGGIVSAYQIAKMGPTSFTNSFLTGLGSQEAVDNIYHAAHHTTSKALAIFAKVRPEFYFPSISGFTTPGCSDPDLEAIFGSLDYCECRHCDSIHGPAAYFVDIMQFLRLRTDTGATAYTKLTSPDRRPELPKIELSCENTDTPMPTLDIVNEILEQAVLAVNNMPVNNDRQTTWSAGDLLAHPEHLDSEAYVILADHTKAYHPWSLPFSLHMEEIRTYLDHLRLERIKLLDLFAAPFPETFEQTQQRVDEVLGLSPGQATILRLGQNTPPTYQLWGFPNVGTWVDDLNDVETFLEKSRLSLAEVQELLRTPTYSNIEIVYAKPCQLKGAEFKDNENPGFDETKLTKLHTFLRLRLNLGWSMLELDSALRTLELTLDVPAADLPVLAEVVRVQQLAPGSSLFEVLTLWGNLETQSPGDGIPSFYDKAVRPALRDPAFHEPNTPLSDIAGSLQSIMQVRDDEFSGALELAGLTGADTLTPEALAKLYRIGFMARILRVGIDDLTRLVVDLANVGDPFSGGQNAPVRVFIERARTVLDSPFTPAELTYIFKDADSEKYGANDPDVSKVLIDLILGLQQAAADHEAQLPSADRSALERLEILLARELEGGDLVLAMAFVRKEYPENADGPTAVIERDKHFTFLSATSESYNALGTAFADLGSQSPEKRAGALFDDYAAYLLETDLENTVIQQLTGPLGLEPATTKVLLEKYTVANSTALSIFIESEFFAAASFDSETDAESLKTEAFPKIFLERNSVAPRAELFRDLIKAALVTARFELEGDLLVWLLTVAQDDNHKAYNFVLDLTEPGKPAYTERWLWMVRLVHLRDEIFTKPRRTIDILTEIFEVLPTPNNVYNLLAEASEWDSSAVTSLAVTSGIDVTGNDYEVLRDLTSVNALALAFQTALRSDVDPLTLLGWGTEVLPTGIETQANAIKALAQSKYSSETWPSIAQPLRDVLREKQRDAMVAYLLPKYNLDDSEDLLGRFLIDVDVSACAKTSRLKSAISAVQLFIQRAFMNLESGVAFSDGDSVEWSWMKRYRVWEANRKIFLYPENWLSPELRDDRTELFRNLEGKLAEGEADEASVDDAYLTYLEGLHNISRLNICGLYQQVERDQGRVSLDVLHTFGRTRGEPSKLYYRQWINRSHWTSWEELTFKVDGQGVLPVIRNHRLLLMWPQLVERDEEKAPTSDPVDNNKFREIRLTWSEKNNGVWSAPRVSDSKVHDRLADHTPASYSTNHEIQKYGAPTNSWDISLTSFLGNNNLYVRVKTVVSENNILSDLKIYKPADFIFDDCDGNIDKRSFGSYPEYAIGPWTLYTGTAPPPQNALPQHQGFYKPSKLNEGLRLPVWNGVGYDPNFTERLIHAPSDMSTLPPRQDLYLDTRRPQAFQDRRSTFFFVPERRLMGSDTFGDKSNLGELESSTLLPYLQFDSGAEQPTTPTQNLPQAMVLGLDTPSATQVWGMTPTPKSPKYRFYAHYHPYTCLFLEQVRRHGVAGLLDPIGVSDGAPSELVFQQANKSLESLYEPSELVLDDFPVEDIDFSFGGAYSVYNWELFYHAPMLIADRLMANRQFADAQKWLHYIFDPTRSPTELENTNCRYYWRIKPFREASAHTSLADLLASLSYEGDDPKILAQKKELEDQVEDWRTDPFRPHRIARMRIGAYMRAVVMKYLDNLIEWGDDLFRQDTIETTNEATQLYVLALQILGKRPRKLPRHDRTPVDYDSAKDVVDSFSNFFVWIENLSPGGPGNFTLALNEQAQYHQQLAEPNKYVLKYVQPDQSSSSTGKLGLPKAPPPIDPFPLGPNATPDLIQGELYFCIPPNSKLLSYWDTVADRLFKLRNCLNIEGIRRDLPLFEPPIDPALLARAVAQGVDIATAVSNLMAPLPHYRFLVHLGIAKDFSGQVQNLGSALLSALEKQDAEKLAVLRARQENEILAQVRIIREKAIEEAQATIDALEHSKSVAQTRLEYYSSRERVSTSEARARSLAQKASDQQFISGSLRAMASALAAIPDFEGGTSGVASPVITASFGGSLLYNGLLGISEGVQISANVLSADAQRIATDAGYDRRKDDWDHQAKLATKELEQIDKQITAATIRKELAEQELVNHDQQAANSQEVFDYLQTKFTNTELYGWMSGELSRIYYQAYQIAVDLARRSERCFQYELADPNASFVTFGHWDNRRKGLLAGERLANDIRRMEAAFYERNRREYELVKRVSLVEHDPAALIALRETGTCHFNLPEALFDLDHPGHYLRRIKMVGVTVPAVTGPYTNVNATLTYETGKIRTNTEDEPVQDFHASVQSVATSTGEDDPGLFEPNFRDERYLPFEGKGLIDSYWRVQLPARLRQFNYDTISDVVLTIRYTAREGGAGFRQEVESNLAAQIQGITRPGGDLHGVGQVHMFSARANFPDAWRIFLAAGDNDGPAELELDLADDSFPNAHEPKTRNIERVIVFVRWAGQPPNTGLTQPTLTSPGNNTINIGQPWDSYDAEPDNQIDRIWFKSIDVADPSTGLWKFAVDTGWTGVVPDDIIVLVQYKLGN